MDVFNPAIFAAGAPCLPCCGAVECACALEIPPPDDVTPPYADYATAAAAIAAQVSNCIGYVRWDGVGVLTSFTADDSVADEVTLVVVGNPDNTPSCQAKMWVSLNMKAGSTLTVVSSAGAGLAMGSGGGELYSCDGTLIDEQHGATVNFSITADGEYLFAAEITSVEPGFGGGSDTLTSVLSSDDAMTANPVIALWDDSGTTRQLEACPRLEMVPTMFNPFSTQYYANTADADTDFGNQTSNCVGIIRQQTSEQISFSATDGGTSLNLDGNTNISSVSMLGAVNAEGGETLTFAFTLSSNASTPEITVEIVDNEGNQVELLGPATSSPLVSSALPYSGNYVLIFGVSASGSTDTAGDVTTTSSGALSVIPITALIEPIYTDGCPIRYDCT